MAKGSKWKRSSTDELWFYIPADKPTSVKPTKKILNAVKFGKGYRIYYDTKPFTPYKKAIKKVKTKKEAIAFMKAFMRKK